MKLTIGKKLTSSFLLLALLVLLSGIVGIVVLKKVSRSNDIVVKEKVPILTSAMKADLAVAQIEKFIDQYIHSSSDLAQQEKILLAKIDEFDMWISMLEYGTSSDKFKKSRFYDIYKTLKLNIIVPKSSKKMLQIVSNMKKESSVFKKSCLNLIKVHNKYSSYSVIVGGKSYDLPFYLMLLQKDHRKWFHILESDVITVAQFQGNTDPGAGMLGTFIHTYKTKDKRLIKLLKKLDKYNKKLLKNVIKINQADDSAGKTKALGRSAGSFERINQYLGRVQDYITPVYQKLDKVKARELTSLTRSVLKINQGLKKLVKNGGNEMSAAMNNSESSQKNGTFFLIVLTLAAVIIALGLGIFMSRYMTRTIKALALTTRQIAQGDLTKKVNVSSRDELGDLAEDTNAMTKNLKEMIMQMTGCSEKLTTAASDLSGLASSMSEGARNVTGKSESVAAAAEEMSANMTSVAATSEQAATNINTVSIAANEINSSINEIAKNSETGNSITREAVEKAGSATRKVNELGNAAKEISKVTEVISEISEQTNLLALNATIEAARAGEAGKGFAVVASEIKQLALQTAAATNDIKTRIEGIQNSTADTVNEIEDVAKIIETINEIVGTIAAAVEEQSATTKEITQNMGQATEGLQEVSENVAQSSSVSGEIARDIGDVNTSSSEVLKDCEIVNTSSDDLKKLADELEELINRFKI